VINVWRITAGILCPTFELLELYRTFTIKLNNAGWDYS